MDNFPDVQQKLAAPKKLSAFEKERQAAALKQQRAEEENAAALREFEESFANDGGGSREEGGSFGRDRGPPSGPRGYGYDGPRGRGGMPPMGPRSGPGSLGPLPPQRSGPGSLGPPNVGPPHAAAKPPMMPFGAEKPREERPRFSMRNAPPPGQFAPPDSYGSSARPSYGREADSDTTVSVQTPLDIADINAIHMVADYLLQMRDPSRAVKAEALLMRIPAVRQDERMAFLYDSRSPAGLYYRWLLWAPEDANDAVREAKRRARGPERIFSDVPIDWLPPTPSLPFPDLKSLADAVTDIDYESSDEESDEGDGEARQYNRGPQGEKNGLESSEKRYLTPLKRARLVYLLARLPTSIAKLRKGDVARVTNFAITNAGFGAEEIVDTLLLNVAKPFCYSLAAKFEDHSDQDEEDVYEPDEDLGDLDTVAQVTPTTENKKDDDWSNARLIGVYIISDILSASSTAGVRNAWRYRQLFEGGFKAQKTLAQLGKMEKELAWGRIKAEQWKRKIDVVLSTWEGWSVFGSEVMDELRRQFFGERKEEETRKEGSVEVKMMAESAPESGNEEAEETMDDIDGVPISDSDEG